MTTCERCATQNPPDARVCVSCGTALQPVSWTSAATEMQTYTEYASFWERVGATLLDGLILVIPAAIVGSLINTAVAQVLQLAYFIYFTGSTGQTLGKRVLNIKVMKADGSPMEYGSAVLRELVGKFVSAIILGIGFLFPLWDPRKQALHDKIASTIVVKVPRS